ncbi:MAG: hypothetical protein ACRDJO_09165 [Actinomycetota bacterium]
MKYCNCGQLLLLSVDENTITLPTGTEIPFRRATDFVSCDQCFSSFAVTELRGEPPPPVPHPTGPGVPDRRRS